MSAVTNRRQLVSKVGADGFRAGERTDTLASSLAVWIDHDRMVRPMNAYISRGAWSCTKLMRLLPEHRVTVRVDQLDLAGWSNSLGN